MEGPTLLSSHVGGDRFSLPATCGDNHNFSSFVQRKEDQRTNSFKKKNEKYHEHEAAAAPSNIMSDRRVIRGSTYSSQLYALAEKREEEKAQKEKERRMKAEALHRRKEALKKMRPFTPPPVDGRLHAEIQTEPLLEVLSDRPIEFEVHTQTEAALDYPTPPLFVPAKRGTDQASQVIVKELFNFDLEVEPLLEVLIGKTLEYSAIEVLEEAELAILQQRQDRYNAIRGAELAEVQRLEAESLRYNEERKQRIQQEKEAEIAQRLMAKKVAAQSFARQYLSCLNDEVFVSLERSGHFYNPVQREVEQEFMPTLIDAINLEYQRNKCGNMLLESILADAGDICSKRRNEKMLPTEEHAEVVAITEPSRSQEVGLTFEDASDCEVVRSSSVNIVDDISVGVDEGNVTELKSERVE